MNVLLMAIDVGAVSKHKAVETIEQRCIATTGSLSILWLTELPLDLKGVTTFSPRELARVRTHFAKVGGLDAKTRAFLSAALTSSSNANHRAAGGVLALARTMGHTTRAFALRCINKQLALTRGDDHTYWGVVKEMVLGRKLRTDKRRVAQGEKELHPRRPQTNFQSTTGILSSYSYAGDTGLRRTRQEGSEVGQPVHSIIWDGDDYLSEY